MASGGISTISFSKGAEDKDYVNKGFEPEPTRDKSHEVNMTTSNSDGATGGDVKEQSTYDEITESQRRDSGMVDFNIPSARRASRKSATGSADGKRSRSGSEGGPYRGMGKEELLRYSGMPFWRNLRYVCMTVVLTGWLALLITVVAIVLIYPHCREAQPKDWWQKAVIYRVYVPSFLDSDCDGIGDIKGVLKKLDYLQDLGVDTISLSPIYTLGSKDSDDWSSLLDTHIKNHTDIDPKYGKLADLQLLINQTHQRGMHITLDFIPNHTSDDHPWFQSSSSDEKPNPYRSYYVWADGEHANQLRVPNNWKSVYDCSAWKKNDVDNRFYLHQFMTSQPDLNLRSQKVKDELEAILKFWLDMGVDGFYIRNSNFLFEDYDLRSDTLLDENATEITCGNDGSLVPYDAYDHGFTQGLPENFDMLARWRAFLDDYGRETNEYKILLADVDGTYRNVMDYYGLFNRDGVDFPLNKFSLDIDKSSAGLEVAKMVDDWMRNMPQSRWPNWMGGDDRSIRLADRMGDEMAKPYLVMIMLLPGTPYVYYGDEIGLQAVSQNTANVVSSSTNSPGSTEASVKSINRSMMSMRGPMQWNNKSSAGFSNMFCQQPWIPLNPDYTSGMNVDEQSKMSESILNLFRNLTELRRGKPSFEYGDYVPLVQDDQVFSFVREFDGEKGYLVALNFDQQPATKTLYGLHETVPKGASVEVACGNDALHRKGGSAGLNPLKLMPFEGIVVSWDYKAKEL